MNTKIIAARLAASVLLAASFARPAPASVQAGELPDARLVRARSLSGDAAGDASSLALQHYRRGDRPAARRVLDAVPPKLLAFALVEFMSKLSESGERNFPSEMLAEARLALDKSAAPEQEKQHLWLTLTRLHAAYAPSDGPVVFLEAVASINRAGRARARLRRGRNRPAGLPLGAYASAGATRGGGRGRRDERRRVRRACREASAGASGVVEGAAG